MKIEELQLFGIRVDEVKDIIDTYKNHQNVIVVTGEFSSGKSSFINCLLNKPDFLPHGKTECTPILIDISEGEQDYIELRKVDGQVCQLKYSNDVITQYAKYDDSKENDCLSMAVPVQNSGLPIAAHIIDTPGTNTVLKEHEEITKFIIKKADAVLYLFNKVIAQSDITHILDIMQYTNNIIFVMTHVDEIDNKTDKKYSEARIAELISEAKKEISKGTEIEIEDMVICPIGSVDGYSDRRYIDSIKMLIESYVSSQTEEKRKKRAIHKIELIIKSSIENYSLKKAMLEKKTSNEIKDLELLIKKSERDQKKCETEHENRMNEIERQINQQEANCRSELKRLLEDEKHTICRLLTNQNADEREVCQNVERLNREISIKMRQNIERSIDLILKNAYESVNDSLKDIGQDFDASIPLIISTPDIEELDDRKLVAKLSNIEKEIEKNAVELEIMKESADSGEKLELEKKIRECEKQKEGVKDSLIKLGVYKPEFISVINQGGGSIGKKAGRVIGEVADMALLFWTPAGAAANAAKGANEAAKVVKAADQVKDVATGLRYVRNVFSEVAETSQEINQKKGKAKKAVSVIKKVDDGRREIIEKMQDITKYDSMESVSVSGMLDLLSIGYWTEKIGEAVGEAIMPSSTTSVEDLEAKKEYERKRNELILECDEISSEIANLKDELLEMDDIGKRLRLEKKLKEKERALRDQKAEIENNFEKSKKENIEKQLKDHYINAINQYEINQKENGERLIQEIFREAKMRLVERVTTDYYEKLDDFRNTIEKLTNSTSDISSELAGCDNSIHMLSQSISQVGMWLE